METKQASIDVYQIVTNRIIELLEQDIIPWRKPWISGGFPQNLISKNKYRGINLLLLNALGYAQNYFLTYNQITQLGGRIKTDEKAHFVVFWKWLDKKGEQEESETNKVAKIPMLRYYKVYNIEQIEGIPEEYIPKATTIVIDTDEKCEEVIANFPNSPYIVYKGDEAFYLPSEDMVSIPEMQYFTSQEGYYNTLFHELVHSTGHATRLNRVGVTQGNKFGSKEYSFEELIAEIGSCFLCSQVGIEKPPIENTASYIKHWLEVLKNDKKFIIQASVQAQKAVDHILNVSDVPVNA